MPLVKDPIVTVIPEVFGRPYSPASYTCTPVAPPGSGGEPAPLPPLPPSLGVAPSAGTPILLETPNGAGGYNVTESVAPAPAGFVCRYQTVWIFVPGQTTPAKQYFVVCTGS